MKKYIFLLVIFPLWSFGQSGISMSGLSQFNTGESIVLINGSIEPLTYEQRNNSITVSIFRGRKFSIGTIALKGDISYSIEKTNYFNESIPINDYEIITRSLVPSLELLYILFQSKKAFLYSSLGSYAVIQNLNISEENHVVTEDFLSKYNSITPFARIGFQVNSGRFFINPFISFDLEKINFNSIDEVFTVDLKEKIENYSIKTGLSFGIMF